MPLRTKITGLPMSAENIARNKQLDSYARNLGINGKFKKNKKQLLI